MSEFKPCFPSYNVLDKWNTPSWNHTTRHVVHERLHQIPQRRFFDPHAYETLAAICDRIIPQPDRPDTPIPIAPFVDGKMDKNSTDGTRYDDMPSMRDSWLLGLRGIDEESRYRFDAVFVDLPGKRQDDVLRRVQRGDVKGRAWQALPPQKFFTHRLLYDIVSVYYAHPAAWSEIGFGGPASPRGYLRLVANRIDPWEAVEEKKEP